MATTGPFYDTMPGPLRRDTLNEMWGIWEEAISTLIKGDAGWSPLIRSVQDGDRVVLEVYDWTGGQGDKPIQTGFLGSTGFVATADLAIDIRGPQGLRGIQGEKGDTGLTGDKGDAATISVGTVTTSLPGTAVEVVNSGTTFAAVFDFTIPQGEKGDTGSSGTISVGTTTTVPEGSPASVTNTGTPSAAIFNFSIPKGDKGDTGTAATITVGNVTTGAPGTPVSVTNSGTSEAAVFDFTIPRGADGSGSGDMLKAEYDSVGDGVVNASRSTPWAGITDKPLVIAAGADAASARLVIDAASTVELNTKAPIDNPTFTGTVSGVTKAMVGLANVDNTSDADKPVSTATQTALNDKVDKVAGKGLSTEDFTTAEKTKLSGIAEGATANQTDSFLLNRANHTGEQSISTVTGLQTSLNNKVASSSGTASGITLNGGYTEQVFNLTGTVISPSNGSIQTKTLSANTTFTETLSNGQSVILGITAGSFSVTWPTMLWTKVGGSGTMPSLTSSGVNWVVLWKVGSTLRGTFLGTA